MSLDTSSSPRCEACAQLSAEYLISVKSDPFPSDLRGLRWTVYHQSPESLKASADLGCGLCRLIYAAFKKPFWEPRVQNDWERQHQYQPNRQIRVCLTNDTWHDVFDRVPRGAVLNTLLFEHGDMKNGGQRLVLPLWASKENRRSVSGHPIGRLNIDRSLASSANFALARRWLNQCSTSHQACAKDGLVNTLPNLPSRVLDVQGQAESPLVRLLITNGMHDRYAALSYCWGGTVDVRLTAKTLELFTAGIDISRLAATIQDAITTTRELGIRYLWVDGLCIIQDSEEDWAAESHVMGQIYTRATVTIAAMASDAAAQGFLRPTRASASRGFATNQGLRLFSGKDEPAASMSLGPLRDKVRGGYTDSPLSQRGWTLQEWIMSPRILCFGAEQIYWRCCAGLEFADGSPAEDETPDNGALITRNLLKATKVEGSAIKAGPCKAGAYNCFDDSKFHVEDEETSQMRNAFYTLVEQYSRRRMTVAQDKLPAIAGLAEQFRPYFGQDYAAGLWISDFISGLCWTGSRASSHATDYRAPTWSWAVTDGPVSFHGLVRRKPETVEGIPPLQLIKWHSEPKEQLHPFGRILSARLLVRGATLPVKWRGTWTTTGGNVDGYVQLDEATRHSFRIFVGWEPAPASTNTASHEVESWEKAMLNVCWSDATSLGYDDADRGPCRALVIDAMFEMHSEENMIVRGLLLKPVTEDGAGPVYERVGLFRLQVPVSRFDWKWKQRTVTLI